MHLNFIVKENGAVVLAQVFSTPSLSTVALTATGEILTEDFYILPSDVNELLSRVPEALEQDGFDARVLVELQSLAVAECACDFPHLGPCP